MNPKRSAAGRKAKRVGDRFDVEWAGVQHEMAGMLGILVHIEHNQPHTRMVKNRVIYTRKGVADYTGTLYGGRSFAAEFKSTDDERLMRSAIQAKQAEHLDRVAKAGGLALLLVEFRTPVRKQYAVPWLQVPWKTLRSAESLSQEDVSTWLVPAGKCYLDPFMPTRGPAVELGPRRVFPRE
jgi:hypothetical protein